MKIWNIVLICFFALTGFIMFVGLNLAFNGMVWRNMCIHPQIVESAASHYDFQEVMDAYESFLKRSRSIYENECFTNIDRLISSEGDKNIRVEAMYAFFDTNGDGLPELHIRAQSHYYIVTYKSGELVIWANLTPYYQQLNNRAFLHVRNGGTPLHTSYIYILMDFYGDEVFNIYFEKYDVDENGIYDDNDAYFYENTETSKKLWDSLTSKYLSIKTDGITWRDYYEDY